MDRVLYYLIFLLPRLIKKMGLTWEEVEASSPDRHSWRRRVALRIGDAG